MWSDGYIAHFPQPAAIFASHPSSESRNRFARATKISFQTTNFGQLGGHQIVFPWPPKSNQSPEGFHMLDIGTHVEQSLPCAHAASHRSIKTYNKDWEPSNVVHNAWSSHFMHIAWSSLMCPCVPSSWLLYLQILAYVRTHGVEIVLNSIMSHETTVRHIIDIDKVTWLTSFRQSYMVDPIWAMSTT